ncbi:hypothetical protein [Ancylobacter sp. G4_0304]|uniref:hypothetical protein n=1 Tax=Ancylobacter sp. G4_0304 TaxID=3114289 RepID=UPI0039C6DDF6
MADQAVSSTRRTVSVADVKVFRVVNLLVDEDNFRMEPNLDQPSAIKAMLRKQGKKLVALAEEIVEFGLSRGEFIWVAPDPRPEFLGKYVVCEGNRRITALKILGHPALAEGTEWARRFRELSVDYKKRKITQVRAVLYPSTEAARPDVYRRHTNDQDGKGLEAWDPFAQDRANKHKKVRRNLSMVVMEHITSGTIESFAEHLGLYERTTNADRLLSTFSRSKAGDYGIKIRATHPYTVEFGADGQRGAQILKAVLAGAAVSVNKIKSEEERLTTLEKLLAPFHREDRDSGEEFEEGALRDEKTEADDSGGGHVSEGGDTSATTRSKTADARADSAKSSRRSSHRDPLSRATLAPTEGEYALHVKGVRLPGLYKECKQIKVEERPNAAAMLLRVFLELSCEAYLEHHNVRPSGPGWSAIGTGLEVKVRKVLARVDPNKDEPDLRDAQNGISEDFGHMHSVRSLHRAMHDRNHLLNAQELKMAWQRWHPLLKRIHESI